jgi:hypothetical protein
MAKKVIGISIDGVIRDYLFNFDKMYRKEFIKNDSLVEMEGEMGQFRLSESGLPTDEEFDKLRALTEEKIHLPVDTYDIRNHYIFNSEDELNKFMYEDFVLEIFGTSPTYPRSMDYANKIQTMAIDSGDFEVVLLSRERGRAVTATYHFLSKSGCRIEAIKFVQNHEDKWDYCDILIDDSPTAFENKPEGKMGIKMMREYNKYTITDHEFESLLPIANEEFISGIINPKTI